MSDLMINTNYERIKVSFINQLIWSLRKQDEFEEINLVYTEEKQQLKELEERFATLEKEYTAIMEERRVARDKRERAQRELAILVKSATTIQAFWRSYKVRKALKAKSKKKGGKKKSAN
ncbi:IQ domain-containing protein D [Elysia marginata]|uniref:Dynein regulatory complex protein 10 n=1 Tax=Elysia marginata TaxID=1093978 RepID=A0AAV4JE03_9GAST|nr:IQ domain-containing protein D [Elysia marginata]